MFGPYVIFFVSFADDLPPIHTHAMRKVLFTKFGRLSPNVKLRYLYSELNGDHSAADTTDQAEIDAFVCQIIELEDCDIIPDLRTLNSSISRANTFWSECDAVLNCWCSCRRSLSH